jgi:tetratricopeptide (TPR) repeat protein
LPRHLPTLATLLAEQGYATGAFVSAFPLAARFGLKRGFQVYDDKLNNIQFDGGRQLRDAASVTGAALDWLMGHSNSPFFCWVHYYDPHHPYTDHSNEFGDRFKSLPYDAEIAYVDQNIRKLTDFLKERSLDDRTLVVVIGDHGESLGEHGERRHGCTVYNATQRVPLLFRLPAVCRSSVRVGGNVPLVDVFPTVLDLLSVPLPSGTKISGRSLSPALRQGSQIASRTCYAESLEPLIFRGWSPVYSLLEENWKYIRSAEPELYNLATDPGEIKNLASAEPSRLEEMEERLLKLEAGMIHGRGEESALTAAERGKLEGIGYLTRPVRQDLGKGSGPDGKKADAPDIKRMLPLSNKTEDAEELLKTDPKSAERLAREVIDVEARYDAAWIVLGNALEKQGRLEPAIAAYLRALEIDPAAYMAEFHLGNLSMDKRDLKQAVARFERALHYRPDSASIHANLGNALLLMGQNEKALSHLETATEQNPADVSARLSLANVLTQMRKFGEARRIVEAALKLDPGSADGEAQLALLLFRQGERASAFEHFHKAIQLNPREPLTHFNFGVALHESGRPSEAIMEFEKSLELKPEDPVTLQNLKEARQAFQRQKSGK